jgi:hypothetical protein
VTAGGIRVRTGTTSDAARLLPLYDQAVTWLASHGRAAQWGPEPWSAQPDLIARLNRVAESGALRLAQTGGAGPGGHVAGALWLTQASEADATARAIQGQAPSGDQRGRER